MKKKRTNKSGFRTPELAQFQYQVQFFERFIKGFPQALEELKDLLPLTRSIFGMPRRVDEFLDLYNMQRFVDNFLSPPEEILTNYFQDEIYYKSLTLGRRQTLFPEFVKLPSNHKNKRDEDHYKTIVESTLIWKVAQLRAESGDSTLYDSLENQRLRFREMEGILKTALQHNYIKHGIEVENSQISVEALCLLENEFDTDRLIESPDIDELINNYWNFYQKFHSWLNKYYVQKSWLRRSFFIALCRGLKVFVADIRSFPRVPEDLHKELDGENSVVLIPTGNLPEPEPFFFNTISKFSNKNKHLSTQNKWQADPFWLFDVPQQYKAQQVEKFRTQLNTIEPWQCEGHIIDIFSAFIDDAIASESLNYSKSVKIEFQQHIENFQLFKEAKEERNRIIKSFENHVDLYLDELIPIINKCYKTNAGRPHNFEHIEWLLCWNINQLTGPEILEKFNIASSESAIFKVFSQLKKYDLPVRRKNVTKVSSQE